MNININDIGQVIQLITILAPGVELGVESLIGALKRIGAVETDAEADANLRQTIIDALKAKAEADAAAAGQDPQ